MFADAISFRMATADDTKTIRRIVRLAYAKWIAVIGREPRPMTADYERAVQEHRFALLCIGAEVVGLIETATKDDHLWIENVAVSPNHQGKGLGRRLLDHAERDAADAGFSETRLLTNADFRSNVSLYHHAGYVITHQEPFMGGTAVYMSKRLTQSAPQS